MPRVTRRVPAAPGTGASKHLLWTPWRPAAWCLTPHTVRARFAPLHARRCWRAATCTRSKGGIIARHFVGPDQLHGFEKRRESEERRLAILKTVGVGEPHEWQMPSLPAPHSSDAEKRTERCAR